MLKTAWYWYSDRQVDQWNRIEDPEMNPHTYGHLILDKEAENIQWKTDSLFNKWCWFNWRSACRRMRIDPSLSPCTKLKSKWIKDLHIKPDIRKLIEKKLGNTPFILRCLPYPKSLSYPRDHPSPTNLPSLSCSPDI